jgi:NADH-quinone oxidoreductase subunit F
MNFEQIVAMARSDCPYLDEGKGTTVYVAATAENVIAPRVFTLFSHWAESSGGKGKIIASGSFGYYDLEPVVIIERPGSPCVYHGNVTEEAASQLIRDCLEGGKVRADLALCTTGTGGIDGIPRESELPLFSLQKRIALRNCGLTDPESISHYVAGCGGYTGLSRALVMSRGELVEELKESRLRGRGGAGYVTADKWRVVQESEGVAKYVICNGVEGDPRARTAELLLGSDPHSVLEGLLIAAYAVGASQCIIAVAADAIIERIEKALVHMKGYGLLGENILDSGFNCDVEVRRVARSLVAGEETALLRSLEGKQPMPYIHDHESVALTLSDAPVLVHNIETLANVSAILERGADWFSGTGTEKSTGGKVVTLSGAVVHGYTVEVPFGTALASVIREIGGGVPGGGTIKAVQFGGPTGAYFGKDDLDLAIDYETLRAAGSVMGFATVEVVADGTCAVEMTAQLMEYLQGQSCGKCVFCREGTFQMSDILKDIVRSEGKTQDLDLMVELGEEMRMGSICGFGRSAANPVLSSISLFRQEYDAHIKGKRCPQR